MAELKTQKNNGDVEAFLAAVEPEWKRQDSREICRMMQEITGAPPVMWGPTIVGFGSHPISYADGRVEDWMEIGFSPRKQNLTLYVMHDFDRRDELLERLGKHSTGKVCLYIKRLSDVDRQTLREVVEASVAYLRSRRGA